MGEQMTTTPTADPAPGRRYPADLDTLIGILTDLRAIYPGTTPVGYSITEIGDVLLIGDVEPSRIINAGDHLDAPANRIPIWLAVSEDDSDPCDRQAIILWPAEGLTVPVSPWPAAAAEGAP